MSSRAKRLPRLWCALQGLLPLEDCLAAQRGELAWPAEPTVGLVSAPNHAVGVKDSALIKPVVRSRRVTR